MRSIYLCPDCDLSLKPVALECGERMRCPRCLKILSIRRGSLRGARALVVAALALYIPANVTPILVVNLGGSEQSFILIYGVLSLWNGGMYLVAGLVFLFSLLVPLLTMLSMAIVLLPHRFLGAYGLSVMWVYSTLRHWDMLDICLLGILVAIIKLSDFSTVYIQPGFWFVTAMMFFQLCASQYLPIVRLWRCYASYHREPISRGAWRALK